MSRKGRTITKVLGLVLTVLLVLGGTFLLWKSPKFYFGQEKAEAAGEGWLTGWGYRQAIVINNPGSSTLSDYQVLIDDFDTASLVSAGKMLATGNDIRFTKSDGTTELPYYWIDPDTMNTSATDIWVKVDSIAASGNTIIYMYYGNPSASSASDASATFEFFDDFSGAAQWTGIGTYGTTDEGYASASQTGDGTSASTLLSNVIGSGDFKVTLKIKSTGSAETGCSYEHKLIQVNSAGETVLDSNAYTDYTEKTYNLSGTDVELKLNVSATGSLSTTNTLILRPNGAGSETSISYQYPDPGEHWDKVDEETADNDSTYVCADMGNWERDLYALEDASQTGDIEKIRVYWKVKCHEAIECGACEYQDSEASIRTHSTTYDGSGGHWHPCISYDTFYEEWTTNPYTGNAWTWDEINSLEAGVNLYSDCYETGEPRVTQVYVEVYYGAPYSASAEMRIDDVRVRKYTSLEPSISIGEEEAQ